MRSMIKIEKKDRFPSSNRFLRPTNSMFISICNKTKCSTRRISVPFLDDSSAASSSVFIPSSVFIHLPFSFVHKYYLLFCFHSPSSSIPT
mmetsp:Transcript_28763/g.83427  ORF Transcript_28763/g.83427 Transcript_28763/m.83427 type:complete len:90 (+) Transcript_28763:135-404(+)